MWFPNFFQSLTSNATRCRSRPTPLASRLGFEPLEERRLLAFLTPVSYSAGGYSANIKAADFNGDGRADLAATGFSGGAVRLGNGDGTFQATSSQPGAGSELTAGDLNGDSKTDLVSINDLQLRVLLGNGDGTFQPPQVISLPSQLPPGAGSYLVQKPTSVVLGDLNADGLLDLIAGGYDEVVDGYGESRHDGYVNVLLGNGNGTFAPNAAYRVADNSLIAVLGVGDFDGDGKSDVLATDHYRLSTLVGNGNGTLQAAPNTSDVGFFTSGTSDPVADFDRDGKLDVFLGATVARGNGDGTFTPSGLVTFGAAVQSVDVGDVNADGKLDIVGLSSINQPSSDVDYTSSRFARILLGNGDGSFAAPLVSQLGTIPTYSYFSAALLADFDGDGSPDLAASDYQNWNGMVSGRVTVSLNDGIWSSLPPTPPVVSIGDATVTEGNLGTSVATFIVTLTAASSQPVNVAYASANGTAGSSDYQAAAGTLTIPAGQTTRTITVLVNGDRLGEANETFFVNLSNPTGATIADGQGAGTIVDDEPRISISDVSKSEGRRSRTTLFSFTVTLSAAYDQPVTMSYRTVNGTATTSGGDYIARTGTLFFAPGETTKTITISVKGDGKREGNETFYLDLFGNSSNSQFTKSRGIGTILNDD